MTQKIVCLGWGSLIWDSRELGIPLEKWNGDGPFLPIEFVRFSNDGRVTLVIDTSAKPVQILWAEMHQSNLDEAIEALRRREGPTNIKNIHFLSTNDSVQEGIVRSSISKWMQDKGITSVIWTGLSYSTDKKPTIEDVISHIHKVTDPKQLQAIKEYIRKAPAQIDTVYRRVLSNEFGWHPNF